MKQPHPFGFKVLLLSFLALGFGSSPASFAGGRSDDGGRVGGAGHQSDAATFGDLPVLREDPNKPPISLVDPMTHATRASKNGCKIPTGEVDYLDRNDVGDENLAKVLPQWRETEHRMAPTEGCKFIQYWSFYRSRENQLRYHSPPKKCELYNSPTESSSKTASAYRGYYCQKIPFFQSREAALKANAQAPYAYAERESVVVEKGLVPFNTRWTDIFSQRTSGGKVIGTSRFVNVPLPVGMQVPQSCGISDAMIKLPPYPEPLVGQSSSEGASSGVNAGQE